MMFARRRADAAKQHAANKALAHQENHAKALEKAKAVDPKPKAVKDGADKPGAK